MSLKLVSYFRMKGTINTLWTCFKL